MAADVTRVRVALSGNVWVADLGTAVPTDITTTPSGSWTDLGYCTDDGVSISIQQSVQDIPGWQSMDPLRIIVTAEPKSFQFTLRQCERLTWTTTFGGSVTTLGANNYKWTPPAPGTQTQKMWLIEFLDATYKYRFAFRNCQQQGARELTLNRSDAVNLPLEYRVLAASPQAWELYTNDPAFA